MFAASPYKTKSGGLPLLRTLYGSKNSTEFGGRQGKAQQADARAPALWLALGEGRELANLAGGGITDVYESFFVNGDAADFAKLPLHAHVSGFGK